MAEQHLDSNGNPQVDFVWGNMPMQPNYGRVDAYFEFGGGYNNGDNQWAPASKYISDTLNTAYTVYSQDGWISQPVATNHLIAYQGYSNFPGYLPNYAGDGDADLETTVPSIVGKSLWQAEDALDKAYLDYDWEWYYTLSLYGLETDGVTGKVWLDEWPQLIDGLRSGDVLWFDWWDGSQGWSRLVTVSGVGIDPGSGDGTISFKFNDPIAEYSYNNEISGSMYAGSEDTYGRVLTMDNPWMVGNIVNEGTGVYFYVLGDD